MQSWNEWMRIRDAPKRTLKATRWSHDWIEGGGRCLMGIECSDVMSTR